MDNKKMTVATIVIFILALLVFLSTVYLTVFKPSVEKSANSIDRSSTENVLIGPVSTQIGDSGRYYKGTVYLEVVGKKTPDLVEKKMPQIQDTILQVISTSSVDNITGDLAGIKEEIRKEVNNILGGENVIDVLFTESIVQ